MRCERLDHPITAELQSAVTGCFGGHATHRTTSPTHQKKKHRHCPMKEATRFCVDRPANPRFNCEVESFSEVHCEPHTCDGHPNQAPYEEGAHGVPRPALTSL